jgi:hypothetical protein
MTEAETMKLVINKCYGGFGLSDAAYERLGELGVPIKRYTEQKRGPDGLYLDEPANDGEVIFDRDLTPPEEDSFSALYWQYRDAKVQNRYWETWLSENRAHPLLIRVVEEMGDAANGMHAKLAIVEIPDGTEYGISEYDGVEHVAEAHRTWS